MEEIRCKKVYRRLVPFGGNYEEWRKSNPDLVATAHEITELENLLNNLDLALAGANRSETNQTTLYALDIFKFETQSRVLEMRMELKAKK